MEPAPTGEQDISPTSAAEMPTGVSATPEVTLTEGGGAAAPTATSSAQPGPTPQPSATPTPLLTAQASATPWPAQILSFDVTPDTADPGQAVTLSWQVKGGQPTLCPTARYVLFTPDDCQPVPVSGSLSFIIPAAAEGFPYVSFVLTVRPAGVGDAAVGQVSVALNCDRTWFFSDEPQAGICPREAVYTAAAAQHFQQGTMVWLAEPGRYYVLQDRPVDEGESRRAVDIISDPLDITGDTSAGVKPPPGLHAPQSGFGLVWRGDVAQSQGYRKELGWALGPEFGYDGVLQCDDARPSGGRSWQTCYLLGPDGEVIVLHPLGGWSLLGEPR